MAWSGRCSIDSGRVAIGIAPMVLMGGAVMRRVIGALVLFLAVVFVRGGGVFYRWLRTPPFDTERGSVHRVNTSVTSSSQRVRRSPVRGEIPPDYLRTPLGFLSTAPVDSLILLPGIGPVLADRIVGARTGKRSFTRWDDLLVVKGIGPKTLDRLKRLADGAN